MGDPSSLIDLYDQNVFWLDEYHIASVYWSHRNIHLKPNLSFAFSVFSFCLKLNDWSKKLLLKIPKSCLTFSSYYSLSEKYDWTQFAFIRSNCVNHIAL